jgi:hypothetical protein
MKYKYSYERLLLHISQENKATLTHTVYLSYDFNAAVRSGFITLEMGFCCEIQNNEFTLPANQN